MKRTQENHIKDQTDGGEEEDVFVLKKKEKVKKQNKKNKTREAVWFRNKLPALGSDITST